MCGGGAFGRTMLGLWCNYQPFGIRAGQLQLWIAGSIIDWLVFRPSRSLCG